MPDRPDPQRAGSQLFACRTDRWLTDGDLSGPLVVFVHGFDAKSHSLARMATYVDGTFPAAYFDYVSHTGIDRGATELARRLARFEARLRHTGFALVGHSMGGLVANWFARHAKPSLRDSLRGVVTLCSPHGTVMPQGTPRSRRRFLAIMLDVLEHNESANPYNRSLACAAAKQLLGEDPEGLLRSLLEDHVSAPLDIPILTVSGGRNYIELFQPGARTNLILNRLLQANLSLPNDGLVEECSADLTRCVSVVPPSWKHVNDYEAWMGTNHTHVVDNQDVGDLILDWLRAVAFAQRSEGD